MDLMDGVEGEALDLEEVNLVLPGGYILAKPVDLLVPDAPGNAGGLAVAHPDGRSFYITVEGDWSTVWSIDGAGKRTQVWSNQRAMVHLEIATLCEERYLYMVYTDGPPFRSCDEAWRQTVFYVLDLEEPDLGLSTDAPPADVVKAARKVCGAG